MLNAKAFANAAAVIMAVWVVICAILAYIVPDLLFIIAQSWTHAMNLEVLKSSFNPNLGSLVLGLVSTIGLAWVTTFAVITLYNRFKK